LKLLLLFGMPAVLCSRSCTDEKKDAGDGPDPDERQQRQRDFQENPPHRMRPIRAQRGL
jgi:hypothetical protein